METFPAVPNWFCVVVDKNLASKNGFRLYEVRLNRFYCGTKLMKRNVENNSDVRLHRRQLKSDIIDGIGKAREWHRSSGDNGFDLLS